jgi:hypothetical protein
MGQHVYQFVLEGHDQLCIVGQRLVNCAELQPLLALRLAKRRALAKVPAAGSSRVGSLLCSTYISFTQALGTRNPAFLPSDKWYDDGQPENGLAQKRRTDRLFRVSRRVRLASPGIGTCARQKPSWRRTRGHSPT